MTLPFILRFQESCADFETSHSNAGTQSQTFTRREQADPDPDHSSYGALMHQGASAGSMTKTSIPAEHSDDDRTFSPFGLIPVKTISLAGTQTITRIRAEGADEDPGGQQSRIIPSCFLS